MRFVEELPHSIFDSFPISPEWGLLHGGENLAFKLDLRLSSVISRMSLPVLQMREHVLNQADRGFNQIFFFLVRVSSRNSS